MFGHDESDGFALGTVSNPYADFMPRYQEVAKLSKQQEARVLLQHDDASKNGIGTAPGSTQAKWQWICDRNCWDAEWSTAQEAEEAEVDGCPSK